jgi:hypothetical protein
MRAALIVAALLWALVGSAGCASLRSPGGAAGLRLFVEPATDRGPTAVRVSLLNEGDRPIAVSWTFGYYVFLDLRARQAGRDVPLTVEADLFDSVPPYECLRPSEIRSVVLDLENLVFIHGGKVAPEAPFRFDLDRSQPIEVQATYRNGLHKARCALPASLVESPSLLLLGSTRAGELE